MSDWIGYKWLEKRYGATPVQPFRKVTEIARSKRIEVSNGFIHEYRLASFRPPDTFSGHLTFALRHEGIHLEFLSRLFARGVENELVDWINEEPTGQYARRACFLYEWLTGDRLAHTGVSSGNYVEALNPKLYMTAIQKTNNKRWRVRDNLPGTRDFCPTVFRTDKVVEAEEYDITGRLSELESEFSSELLRRSANWLTIGESRSSFTIEGEQGKKNRIERFAAAMKERCGKSPDPLEDSLLAELQGDILGDTAVRHGVRLSPVFVGEFVRFTNIVNYVAPHWEQAPGMLAGLRASAKRTEGASSIIRAATQSFGFVYIHPMSDANGRISRFLVNDVLRRDGALPAPFILPISSTIIKNLIARKSYDQILETVSTPLMDRYRDGIAFGEKRVCEDGVTTDFEFSHYDDAQHVWRYLDLTEHVEYLAELIDVTIGTELRNEANFLRSMDKAKAQINELQDGLADFQIDRIIRSLRENAGKVSNSLKKEFPAIDQGWDDVSDAVQRAFASA